MVSGVGSVKSGLGREARGVRQYLDVLAGDGVPSQELASVKGDVHQALGSRADVEDIHATPV